MPEHDVQALLIAVINFFLDSISLRIKTRDIGCLLTDIFLDAPLFWR